MDNKLGFTVLTLTSLFGSITAFLVGGFDSLLKILLTLVIIDYLTGIISASVNKTLSSRIGFKGIAQKVVIFSLVAVAHLIDMVLGYHHFIRDWTIMFYIANEILSILENAGKVGIPIPPIIKRTIELLRKQGPIDSASIMEKGNEDSNKTNNDELADSCLEAETKIPDEIHNEYRQKESSQSKTGENTKEFERVVEEGTYLTIDNPEKTKPTQDKNTSDT
ncbi:phage holin family protein [Litchfieldia alkalitelluris]|uniref:phage holin family protein n=1 Tax=Litchfieldia alkalitelluris TaxID=304268 RepID=UPI0009964B83|nr:phage holin family protein [Litchfieldia alkalitelluris]